MPTDLAFRQFLLYYEHVKITTTHIFLESRDANEKRKEEIRTALMPYSPRNTVSRLLNQVTTQLKDSNLEEIKDQFKALIDPKFTGYIKEPQVKKDLGELNQQISALSVPLSNHDITPLVTLVDKVTTKHANWLIPRGHNQRRRATKFQLIEDILFKANTLEEAKEKLDLLKMPSVERESVESLIAEYYETNDMLEKRYIPTLAMIKSVGIKDGKEKRTNEILKDLAKIVKDQEGAF